MKKTNTKGFTIIEIGIAIFVIVLVVGIGYKVYQSTSKNNKLTTTQSPDNQAVKDGISSNNKNEGKEEEQSQSASSSSPKDNDQQTQASDGTTSLLGGSLKVVIPSNWSKKSDTELTTTLNSKKYVASFSLSKTETLSTSNQYYTGHGAGLAVIKSSVNTPLWVVRSDGDNYDSWVYVASCEHALCSPKINGQYVFILLSDQTSGSPQKLNFRYADSDANTVLGEFIPIIKSSNLLAHYSS
jgi:Tfp pilus assembly major pilin PilA